MYQVCLGLSPEKEFLTFYDTIEGEGTINNKTSFLSLMQSTATIMFQLPLWKKRKKRFHANKRSKRSGRKVLLQARFWKNWSSISSRSYARLWKLSNLETSKNWLKKNFPINWKRMQRSWSNTSQHYQATTIFQTKYSPEIVQEMTWLCKDFNFWVFPQINKKVNG